MKVSLLHELYHRLFENARFKAIYMPGDYKKEGKDFNTYLEEFFVEYLAVDYNKNKLCNEKSKLQEYLDLNDITENKLCENTLKVYLSKTHNYFLKSVFCLKIVHISDCHLGAWRKDTLNDVGYAAFNKMIATVIEDSDII